MKFPIFKVEINGNQNFTMMGLQINLAITKNFSTPLRSEQYD